MPYSGPAQPALHLIKLLHCNSFENIIEGSVVFGFKLSYPFRYSVAMRKFKIRQCYGSAFIYDRQTSTIQKAHLTLLHVGEVVSCSRQVFVFIFFFKLLSYQFSELSQLTKEPDNCQSFQTKNRCKMVILKFL